MTDKMGKTLDYRPEDKIVYGGTNEELQARLRARDDRISELELDLDSREVQFSERIAEFENRLETLNKLRDYDYKLMQNMAKQMGESNELLQSLAKAAAAYISDLEARYAAELATSETLADALASTKEERDKLKVFSSESAENMRRLVAATHENSILVQTISDIRKVHADEIKALREATDREVGELNKQLADEHVKFNEYLWEKDHRR